LVPIRRASVTMSKAVAHCRHRQRTPSLKAADVEHRRILDCAHLCDGELGARLSMTRPLER
jgi:hypothetical protein